MNKISTDKKLWHLPIAIALCTFSGSVSAFPGGNNSFFGGSNNGCGTTDWPAWTPMYWMEEMAGMMGNGNNNCYPNQQAYGAYPQPVYNPYAATANPQLRRYQQVQAYRNPYRVAYAQRALSPYGVAQNRILRRAAFPWSGMTSRTSGFPFSSALGGQRGGFGNLFGGRKSSSFMPFSSSFGASNPFASMSPMGSFGSPFGGGMNPMSMGGMGMPGMSPMGGMGMPGMSPMSGMGMSPFGGSSFMPKF